MNDGTKGRGRLQCPISSTGEKGFLTRGHGQNQVQKTANPNTRGVIVYAGQMKVKDESKGNDGKVGEQGITAGGETKRLPYWFNLT
ncbi:hypothetical protein I3842_02G060700 [Carya illinoinensis]|uniref:Uncharacterized protein n=1 Tax=Carya illinoinensis TaxID=32201 RepID=A0A922FSW3_CARIL|nr:hypothetical protein I3842_02G060700 [Carya illinoinensis]